MTTVRSSRILLAAAALAVLTVAACGDDALPTATPVPTPGPATPLPGKAVAFSASTCKSYGSVQSGKDVFCTAVSMHTLSDGLEEGDMVVGTGAAINKGSSANVQYTGWLLSDGTQFDSSRQAGRTAFNVSPVGTASVIQGWNEGLIGMKVGGRRRLVIPAALGYGASGQPPTIPANATLVFDIEIVSVG